MSFQSAFQREGWKLQSLFTKMPCYSCLSRVPEAYKWNNIRLKTTNAAYGSLEGFKNQLNSVDRLKQSKSTTLSLYVENTIARRTARKRLLKSYWRLKMRNPQALDQITREEVEAFIGKFTVYSDDILSKRPMIEIFYILREVRDGRFAKVKFTDENAEHMIYLATELKWYDKAAYLTRIFAIEEKRPLAVNTFDCLIQLFSEKKDLTEMEFWLNHMKKNKMMMTEHTVRAFVMLHLSLGQTDTAVKCIRDNATLLVGSKLWKVYEECAQDSHRLIDHTLNLFAYQATGGRKYHLARKIYMLKHELGMSIEKPLSNLINRCIRRRELHIAESIWESAVSIKDDWGARICADYIVRNHLSRYNVGPAIVIWEKMRRNGMDLNRRTMEALLVSCAKAKYHVDTLRLYDRHQKLYPNPSFEIQVLAMRCMVFSRELKSAKMLAEGLLKDLPLMTKGLAVLAGRTIFSLSAKSGDVVLFEKMFTIMNENRLYIKYKALTSLAACYVKNNNINEAKIAFKSIVDYTKGPDVVNFNILMRTVLMEDKKVDHEKILDILKHMALVQLVPDETTMRTMMNYYKPESTMLTELYRKIMELPLRGSDLVFLNNIAITKQLEVNDVKVVAHKFFVNDKGLFLPEQNGQAIERDGITYKILLTASLRESSNVALSERLMKDMISRDIKPPRPLYEMFISSLCKQRKISKARKYIEEMETVTGEKPNHKTYTKLAVALTEMGKPHLAKEVFENDIPKNLYDRRIRRQLEKIE